MNILATVLAGPSGKTSTMRLSCLVVVGCVMITWSWVSIVRTELQPIHESVAAILIGQLVTKAAQRRIETQPKTDAP